MFEIPADAMNDSKTADVTNVRPSVFLNNESYHEKNVAGLGTGFPNDPAVFPRVQFHRLWNDIHCTAQWGAMAGSQGMHRLALSEEDGAVRKWFIKETSAAGCTVTTDAMGNIFAVYPGTSPHLPPIAMGSHLDTQPAGGRYDGILGVLAAVEAIRTLKDAGIRTICPIAAVVWTNEEGAAFFPGCSGSSVWADWVPLKTAYDQKHCVTSERLEDCLAKINAKGTTAASSAAVPLLAHIELHIEQACVLEANKQSIGVVRGIQGIRRYEIIAHGRQDHAGTVRMEDRADALVAASKLVLKVEELAQTSSAYATVGVLHVEHPSPNTIPSKVDLTVDARHGKESTLDELEKQLSAYVAQLSESNRDLAFSVKKIWHSPALEFDSEVADCIAETAAAEYGQSQARSMVSLAGHDSAMTALKVPTAMIFVPSRDGVSHSPLEYTSMEQWYVEKAPRLYTHIRADTC